MVAAAGCSRPLKVGPAALGGPARTRRARILLIACKVNVANVVRPRYDPVRLPVLRACGRYTHWRRSVVEQALLILSQFELLFTTNLSQS